MNTLKALDFYIRPSLSPTYKKINNFKHSIKSVKNQLYSLNDDDVKSDLGRPIQT